MMVESSVDSDLFVKDRELSVAAAYEVCEVLRLELAHEEEDIAAVDREFGESLSYRIGRMLCLNSRL